MATPTQLVVLPGTRQTALGPIPSFVKPITEPPEPDLQRTIKAVLNAKKVAVVVGAGISTAANIPDFRSSTGLFASLKARFPNAKLTSGRDLFDVNAWKDPDTLSLHFGMLAELHKMCGAAQPTAFHQFLKRLDDDGKLSRVYTQNIDGLEEKVGLSYGIPGQDQIDNVSSSTYRSRQDPLISPRKRNLKRKRDELAPTQLPPTPRSTPPPLTKNSTSNTEVLSNTEDEDRSELDHPYNSLQDSRRPDSEHSTSSQCELDHPPSSQLSSISTIAPDSSCPQTPKSKSGTQVAATTTTATNKNTTTTSATTNDNVGAPVPSRPIRTKPVDPFPRVIPLHGTLKNLSCLTCKHSVLMSDYLPVLEEGEPIVCPQCQSFEDARAVSGFRTRGVGVLKSGVVLYGEEHNEGDRVGAVTSRDLMRGRRPDLLIVAGTSLKVPGTKRLVKELSKVIKPPVKTCNDSDEDEDEDDFTSNNNSNNNNNMINNKKPTPIHTIFLNNEFPSPCGLWKDTFDVWVKGNVDQFINLVDQERKNQEELKLKKAQEKAERERRKEERMFKRAHSTSQLNFPTSTALGVEEEDLKTIGLPSSLPVTIPPTPSRRKCTSTTAINDLQQDHLKPLQAKLTLRIPKPSPKESSANPEQEPKINNKKSRSKTTTNTSSSKRSNAIKPNPSSGSVVTGFFKTGKAHVKSESSSSSSMTIKIGGKMNSTINSNKRLANPHIQQAPSKSSTTTNLNRNLKSRSTKLANIDPIMIHNPSNIHQPSSKSRRKKN